MISILNFFQSGWVYMYVILCVSIIAVAIFCERATYLYLKLQLNTDQAVRKIIYFLERFNYKAALNECSKIEKHPLDKILKAGLLKSDKRDKEIELVMEEKLLKEIPIVKARINYLTLFANISTLLGLLGTIFGLISAFNGVSIASAAAKQEVLAQGISVAMSTTAFGLIVAIPCMVGFYVLNNRSDFIIDQFEEKALKVFNVLSSLKRQKELQCQS